MCKIGGVINELKNFHELNLTHYRGLENLNIQGYMAAIAINIKRIISFWLQVWLVKLRFCCKNGYVAKNKITVY